MKPVGPLMNEHRLIERMIALMNKEVKRIKTDNNINTDFILIAADFIRTYADKLHHGKEEDILFRDLSNKSISTEHQIIMNELIEEHIRGREVTNRLMDARDRYLRGEKEVIEDIIETMETLVEFYPKHMEKEDKHFFLPVMEYFSKDEQDDMLNEFLEFDNRFIHIKYNDVVAELDDF